MASSLRRPVSGEQLAQVDNPDPFAVPVWRSPVYRTPHVVIWTVQLVRLVWWVVRFMAIHPLLDATIGLLVFTWLMLGWPGLAAVVVVLVLVVSFALIALRLLRPDWFTRFVAGPGRDKRRWWFYRRHWQAAMTLAGLAPTYRQRVLLPVLVKVPCAWCCGSGDGADGDRAGSRRLRRPVWQPRPRLRRVVVPRP